jgi:A/G-specific adenine glycosylase
MITEQNLLSFQNQLLNWFASEQRSFPWRHKSTPYKILVAEKLLQQTRANEVVVNVFEQLLANYPSPFALAKADVNDVEELFRPLGLVYRAKELCKMAQELVRDYDGQVPNDLKKLLRLTGVGDYSARAVLTFAFEENVPIVDTNVARFLYRLYEIPDPFPSNPARKKSLIEIAANLIPDGSARDFNFALLDLCAKICKLNNPACFICPVQKFCLYGIKKTTN